MADQSLYSLNHAHRSRDPVIEYRIYFAAIFLVSIPGAAVKWTIGFARQRRAANNPGILHRALSDARAITPMIFSA